MTGGKEYIEHIPGNLPIIILDLHGGLLLSDSTANGSNYPNENKTNPLFAPNYLPARSFGINERDDNTDV